MQLTSKEVIELIGKDTFNTQCELAYKAASYSICRKRKVGASVLKLNNPGLIILGWNENSVDASMPCEDINGTLNTVTHAEIMALRKVALNEEAIMFITQPPCNNCKKALNKAKVSYYVVNSFMKWDKNKLQYSLIPPKATKALAKVLTYGARKYKPNNWKQVDDTTRYWDALYRHLEAYRAGEIIDDESGFNHLEHAITNIAFLIELEVKNV